MRKQYGHCKSMTLSLLSLVYGTAISNSSYKLILEEFKLWLHRVVSASSRRTRIHLCRMLGLRAFLHHFVVQIYKSSSRRLAWFWCVSVLFLGLSLYRYLLSLTPPPQKFFPLCANLVTAALQFRAFPHIFEAIMHYPSNTFWLRKKQNAKRQYFSFSVCNRKHNVGVNYSPENT